MLTYALIFLAALAGYTQMSVTVIALSAIGLVTLSHIENLRLCRRAAEYGFRMQPDVTLISSFANSLGATAIAYGSGFVLRLIAF